MRHCCWPFHFIIHARKLFIRPSRLHRIHIHYSFLIDQHYGLLLSWVVVHVLLEAIDYFIFTGEQHNG